ncbi:hypothetical protein LI328DRAFT_131682 [Trichoderma asperelloides]|nr:hypothetical protein LI328DRAFT_131682 [Trichoderma asperelloides]
MLTYMQPRFSLFSFVIAFLSLSLSLFCFGRYLHVFLLYTYTRILSKHHLVTITANKYITLPAQHSTAQHINSSPFFFFSFLFFFFFGPIFFSVLQQR